MILPKKRYNISYNINNITHLTEGKGFMELKLTNIGNSVGMILPKEMRDKMKVGNGDAVYLTETPEGYKISPYNPDFDKEMVAARKLMKKRKAVLRELAK